MYEQLVVVNNVIYKVLKIAIMAMLAAMSLMVFAAVIARFAGMSIAWSEELSIYFFSWLTYIGAAVVLRNRSHIGVSAFLDAIKKPETRRAFILAGQAIILVFALVSMVLSADMVMQFHRNDLRAINLDWLKMSYVFLQVPVSSLLFILFMGEQMLATLRGDKTEQGGHE